MKAFIALAAAAATTSALALGPLETRPTDTRIDANQRIPQQQEGSEGYLSNQAQAAAIGQGRPRVHDGIVDNPILVRDSLPLDDRLVSDVSQALAGDPALRGAYLNVDSVGGEVRVTGSVLDYDQAARVRRVAESVAGPGHVMSSLAPR
jgi:osmotically-inducible protein OsmY